MSGFTITADAMLALLVAVFLVMWSTQIMSDKQLPKDDILLEYGYDFLAVADKGDAISDMIRGCAEVNGTFPCTAKIKSMMQQVPESICLEAELFMQDGTLFYHVDNYNDTKIGIKTGCLRSRYGANETRPSGFTRVSRVAVDGDIIRPVVLELWYKGWK